MTFYPLSIKLVENNQRTFALHQNNVAIAPIKCMRKNIIKRFVILVGLGLLASCATNSPDLTSSKKSEKETVQIPQEREQKDLIKVAQENWLQTGNIVSRNALLIEAAHEYSQNADCAKANIIIANIWSSLDEAQNKQHSQLLKAECAIQSISETPVALDLINSWLEQVNTQVLGSRKRIAQAYLHALAKDFQPAIETLLPVAQEQSILNESSAVALWNWFGNLNTQTRIHLATTINGLAEYQALYQLVESETLSDRERQQAILRWREEFVNHPLNNSFPTAISAFLEQELTETSKVSVLLPLSGRLQAQGDAIKQGIVAAYLKQLADIKQNNPAEQIPDITFYDTGSDSDTILESAQTNEIYAQSDLIIGPLLKGQIQAVKDLNTLQVPSIFLNRADQSQAINSLYFSLSPEDEAAQIARLMIDNGISTPVLISNNSAMARRMEESFKEAWSSYGALDKGQEFAQRPYPSISFTNNKSMRIGITSALDVLQSQRRIAQMENIATETVYSVTRNRRDIDAFVVFARPDQIELINPIIEASISLFSDVSLPVFASSYSYQHQLAKNSIRDLRNMVFIDMPWLMPSQRDTELATQIDTIWNQPNSSFLRLFAFGYDSFQFAGKFQQLNFFKQNKLEGLTGTLQVNAARQVVRQLPLAQVTEDTIIESEVLQSNSTLQRVNQ